MLGQNTASRRQAIKDERAKRIQSVALEQFRDTGYENTAIESIARECEMSVGAIYLYFPSKDDLLLSMLPAALKTLEPIEGSSEASWWTRATQWQEKHPEARIAFRLLASGKELQRRTSVRGEGVRIAQITIDKVNAALQGLMDGLTIVHDGDVREASRTLAAFIGAVMMEGFREINVWAHESHTTSGTLAAIQ